MRTSSIRPETHFILLPRLRLCLGGFSLEGTWAFDVIASKNFFGKFAVAFSATGPWIIEGYGFAIAWRLRQANIAGDRGLEQFGAKEAAQIVDLVDAFFATTESAAPGEPVLVHA